MKIALAIILSGLTTLDAGRTEAPASSLPTSATASGTFVLQPDPRECPSPMCGGYWVSLANHARTRCSDGLLRPRCYVAYVLDARTSGELGPVGGSLARGSLSFRESPDFGRLGQLTANAVWTPVGQNPAAGTFFRIRDIGIRCVRAPCFSMRVSRLNADSRFLVSGIETVVSGATEKDYVAAQRALTTRDGLFVLGVVARDATGGRTLSASRFYLKALPPRA